MEHKLTSVTAQNKSRRTPGKKVKGYFFLLPALILIVVFSYYPFIKTIYLSFFTINANNEVVAFAGLKNYMKVIDDPEFWQAVKNTVRYTVITVPVTLVLSYIAYGSVHVRCNNHFQPDVKPQYRPGKLLPASEYWMADR